MKPIARSVIVCQTANWWLKTINSKATGCPDEETYYTRITSTRLKRVPPLASTEPLTIRGCSSSGASDDGNGPLVAQSWSTPAASSPFRTPQWHSSSVHPGTRRMKFVTHRYGWQQFCHITQQSAKSRCAKLHYKRWSNFIEELTLSYYIPIDMSFIQCLRWWTGLNQDGQTINRK